MDSTQQSTPGSPQPETPRRGMMPAALVFGVVALAGALGLYEISHSPGKHAAHAGACAASLDLAEAVDPLVHGELAALGLASQPNQLGTIAFDNADGIKTTVASFAGKTILLNLWATWCVPCRGEMSALDRLQAQLGSQHFSVVPVNIDTVRLDKPRAFLKEIGATSLPYYADNTADILQSLKRSEKIVGLPTTILIGRDGCEIGTMAGPAQWDSPEAKALIERLAQPPASPPAAT